MKQKKEACSFKKTSIGGQALIEGIMMRGPKRSAMAVRNPQGEIVLEAWDNSPADKKKSVIDTLAKVPIVRGVINFAISMASGYKCLMRSAEISGLEELEEEERQRKAEKKAEKLKKKNKDAVITESATDEKEISENVKTDEAVTESTAEKKEEKKENSVLMTVVGVISFIIAIGLSVCLFIWLPTFLYTLLCKPFPALAGNRFLQSLFEGILKIAILVAYMACVSLMKDIRRTFMYHGAEHKTIFCYEAGLPLTVENVRGQRRFHPRCGTSFLIVMVLVSIFIGFFIPASLPTALRSAIKLLLLPITMGLGYEFIKLAGRHDNVVTRILSAPGLLMQRITVFEPTDDMIECAIAAVKEVIPDDGSDNF